jgi:hypothetical protein
LKAFTAFWLGLHTQSSRNCSKSKRGSVYNSHQEGKIFRVGGYILGVSLVIGNKHIFFFGPTPYIAETHLYASQVDMVTKFIYTVSFLESSFFIPHKIYSFI